MSIIKLARVFFSLLKRMTSGGEAKLELPPTDPSAWFCHTTIYFANPDELARVEISHLNKIKKDEEKERRYQEFSEQSDYDPSKDPQIAQLAKLYKSKKFDC